VTIILALNVARRSALSRLLPIALAAALGASFGCASTPVDTSAAAEKDYGARMAKEGFWHEALFRFRKAMAQKPDDAELQNNIAVAYEAVGETAKALAAYRRALELAPEETHIRRNYARFAEYYTAAQRAESGADVPPPPRPTPNP
jgi:Flp pilus assembly protein TadD